MTESDPILFCVERQVIVNLNYPPDTINVKLERVLGGPVFFGLFGEEDILH